MKKMLLVVLMFTIVLANVPVAAYYETLNIEINGELVDIPAEYGAVIIVDNRTMVPVRFVSEFLNFEVDWIADIQTVIFGNYAHLIMFQIGSPLLFSLLDDTQVEMDVPAMLHDNRSYIPIRFFAENAGFTVDWDEDGRTVSLVRN